MNSNTESEEMICPCCGISNKSVNDECPNCHARAVGEPMVQPENKLPGLGPALTALIFALIILLGFVGTWLLSHDMKVARALLVMALGEGTKFSKTLLQLDPSLLQYRIFTFDAYQLAWLMSLGIVPLSIIGMWLARRAMKLSQLNPAQFGGKKIAATAFALSMLWFVLFSAAGISSIPRALQRGRAKHQAEVRAQFYRMHNEALKRYYAEFGTYPQELSDLRDFVPEIIPVTDYWGTAISYSPTALIASKNSAPGYSTYQLVSAGPDAMMGTADDIQMIDGVIVNATDEGDWFSGFFQPKTPVNDR